MNEEFKEGQLIAFNLFKDNYGLAVVLKTYTNNSEVYDFRLKHKRVIPNGWMKSLYQLKEKRKWKIHK